MFGPVLCVCERRIDSNPILHYHDVDQCMSPRMNTGLTDVIVSLRFVDLMLLLGW